MKFLIKTRSAIGHWQPFNTFCKNDDAQLDIIKYKTHFLELK